MLRTPIQNLLRFLFDLLTRLEVQGEEHIPLSGAAILAANHVSIIDGPLVFILLKRRDATGLVADKYLKNPPIRWLVNQIGGIWINRESSDIQALRAAIAYLEKGGLLGIAPEGTRSHSAALSKAKTGVAFLADRAALSLGCPVPIVPLAITGTDRVFHELKRLRRARVLVRVGEAFTLPTLSKEGRAEALQRNTDEIMSRIACMLPESYRGAYAGCARVLELVGAGLPS